MNSFKIAVFHNYLDNIGGAEIVALTLARELNADIYTTNIDREKIIKMGFKDVLPKIFSIGTVPINPPFKQQLSLWKFRKLDLNRKYNFYIIAGDWATSGAVNNKPNLCYIHSPVREIWDLYKYTRQNIVPWFERWIFDVWVSCNRHLNKKYINSADILVCNSNNTKNRLKKFLEKDATVVHPPIKTSDFKYGKSQDYWLSVNRLITPKRVYMQLETFDSLPQEKLIIVGSYEQARHFKQYADYCKSTCPLNVEIKSWVEQKELTSLYSHCKGFITTSKDEDFGMNVVEAMAAGKPIIAPNEGGYKETVINGKTGILVDNISEDKLTQAIKKMSQEIKINPLKYKDACLEQAQNFDTKVFIREIKNIIGHG